MPSLGAGAKSEFRVAGRGGERHWGGDGRTRAQQALLTGTVEAGLLGGLAVEEGCS